MPMPPKPRVPVLLLALWLVGACSPPPDPSEPLHLRILAIHDFHGALEPRVYPWSDEREVGGAAALKTYMDRAEEDCDCTTLRLDGGDVMQGTLPSNLTFGQSSVAAFNLLGIDAAAIGNHELDWDVDVLRQRIAEAEFAWLAANVYFRDTGERPDWARPWTLVERDGMSIGVVGYLTSVTPSTLRAATTEPYEFRRGYAGIRDAVEAVEAAGADFVAVVAHAGGECAGEACSGEMVELAEESPEGAIDVVVGGHNHEPGQGVANGVPIVRAGGNATALAIVDIFRDADGNQTFDIAIEPIYVDLVVPDAAMTAMLDPWLAEAEAMASAPLAELAEDLSNDRRGDRKLGNMIADTIRLAAGVDVALHNPGGVRAPLLAGPVRYDDVFAVLPFGNEIVTLTLTGADLRDVIERMGDLAYYSNVDITWDSDRTGSDRLVDLRFADGREILEDARYSLALADFLADGGDGLDMLTSIPRESTGQTILDAVVTHLQSLPQPVRLPD